MIAYNRDDLYNMYAQEQAAEALHTGAITPETHDAICAAGPVGLYTPNFFVRIGLGLLTFVIVVFNTSLFAIMFQPDRHGGMFCVFIGVLFYGAAEYLVNTKKHYNSGADNMLVWAAATAFIAAATLYFNYDDNWRYGEDAHNNPGLYISIIAALVCGLLALRFTDTLLSIATIMALVSAATFITHIPLHPSAHAGAVVAMLTSAGLYAGLQYLQRGAILFRTCIKYARMAALLLLYAGGNYYTVVTSAQANGTTIGGVYGIYWVTTFGLPLAFIALGVRRRDLVPIRTGLITLLAAVITFRTYHHVISHEAALLLGGSVLVAGSYLLIRYLKTPRVGFSFDAPYASNDAPELDKMFAAHVVEHSEK